MQVFIYRFEDGIFSSELTFADDVRTITLDARTSDAIALAIRTHAPIFTTPEIIEETGFIIEDPDDTSDDADTPATPAAPEPPRQRTLEEMERDLQRLIDNEEYEEAARLSKLIQQRKDADSANIP